MSLGYPGSSAAYRRLLFRLLPPGPIWQPDADSRLYKVLDTIAAEWTRVHDDLARLVDEADPQTTDELLADWERVAGLPERCDPNPAQDKPTRRRILTGKITATGGPPPAVFKFLADTITGEDCTVVEYGPKKFTAGSPAGAQLYSAAWAFWFSITIPNVDVETFQAGEGAGSPLRTYPSAVVHLACILDRRKQTHTRFFFEFPNDDPLT